MKNSRRNFIQRLGGFAGGMALMPGMASALEGESVFWDGEIITPPADVLKSDEDFWTWVRHSYSLPSRMVNLNSGGVSPHPNIVAQALDRYNRYSNEMPSMNMWRVIDRGRERIRTRLAGLAGCSPDEIAIDRNATEALDTVIFGLDLERGDEVVLSKWDYPNMMNAWRQREMRDGIVLKWAELEMPSTDNNKLAESYTKLFSKKTKVVHITHLINWTGQIMPVRQIATVAKEKGIEVLVDGAHTFAHLDFKIEDLQADYYGTSLHKWLGAPFGTGMLYVRKEKIAKLWPLFPDDRATSDEIRKFENLGTRSFPTEQAISQAMDFHESIGIERKSARLHQLKRHWCDQVADLPGVRFHAPLQAGFSGAICTISIADHSTNDLMRFLVDEHYFHMVRIKHEDIDALRITPNVFTSLGELDRLAAAINEFIS